MVIVFAASEMEPFCKSGELADVVGSLPLAIAGKGHDVHVMIPGYSVIDRKRFGFTEPGVWLQIPVGREQKTMAVSKLEWKGINVYLLENEEYFGRQAFYGDTHGDFSDNGLRFMFYSRGVLETARALSIIPDVIHAHDWPAALVVTYLATIYRNDPFFMKTSSLFTVHRLQHQGIFHESVFWLSGLPGDLFHRSKMEHFGNVSFIKGGIAYADAVSTVSENYAKQIMSEELGFGLHTLFREREKDLYGIVNGIDSETNDPATDPLIPAHYSADDLSGKAACREKLLKTVGLKADDDIPVFGIVSRLDHQKGIHLLEESIDKLLDLDIRLVILGTDTLEHQEIMIRFASRHPQRIRAMLRFDTGMSHLIFAGSDVYIMPSNWEPCGLGQLIAMRYGTIPLVHKTGGLADTIRDLDADPKTGNGFAFEKYTSKALVDAAERAVTAYREKGRVFWTKVMKRIMREDHSWGNSAKKYIELYKKIQNKRFG